MRASRTSSCSNVEAERNELSKWKESMLQVESEWDIQELALRLGGIPGRSARVEVHRCAMEILAEREAANRKIEKLEAELRTSKSVNAALVESQTIDRRLIAIQTEAL